MPPSANLAKWWSKKAVEYGRVNRHLSPYELDPVTSLITSIPSKTIRKLRENGAVLIPSAVLLIGTVKWGVAANDEHHREHWS